MKIEWREDAHKPHYETETAIVDVGVLKQVLAWSEGTPVSLMSLTEVERVDNGTQTLWFRQGGHRMLEADALKVADPSIPVILGFLPAPESPQPGTVFWAGDIVDGFHRIAVAKIRGLEHIPMVKIPTHVAVGATRAKPGFTGPLYREPTVRAPAGYWEKLETWRGRLAGLRGPLLGLQLQALQRDFASIGVGRV